MECASHKHQSTWVAMRRWQFSLPLNQWGAAGSACIVQITFMSVFTRHFGNIHTACDRGSRSLYADVSVECEADD
eukprot:scaffold202459_cov32-Tisochrysis_lutea.AAC.2